MLILASQSPQRAALLRLAGVPFSIQPAHIDERWHANEPAESYVRRLAVGKAAAVDGGRVLGADTCVWLRSRPEPFGKPRDEAEAAMFLQALFEAESHFVSTGVALIENDETRATVVSTEVWMRPAPSSAVQRYLEAGDWRGRAGGYAIQGDAAPFVRRIDGSYTNVVGLPLAETLDLLDAASTPSVD